MFVRIFLSIITLICVISYVVILVKIKLALGSLKTIMPCTVMADSHLLQFQEYVTEFNKTYSSKQEFEERYINFKISLTKIAKLNAIETDAVFGLTKFADMSEQEMSTFMLLERTKWCVDITKVCPNNKRFEFAMFSDKVDDRWDWREHNVIGPVLDQKQCSACWAFSIAGVMESMARIQKVGYEDLSIQEILDCFIHKGKVGCNGKNVFETLLEACCCKWSVVGAKKYPLTLKNENCQVAVDKQIGIRLKSFTHKCYIDEEDLQRFIMHGPVIAIVNAEIWRYYLGGIIQRACVRSDDSKDHAIQIVGYDKTGEIPYYIVKNSWGTDFGNDGYVKLAMGKNMCGIAEDISYLEVEKVST